jgi:hypothetical protein
MSPTSAVLGREGNAGAEAFFGRSVDAGFDFQGGERNRL